MNNSLNQQTRKARPIKTYGEKDKRKIKGRVYKRVDNNKRLRMGLLKNDLVPLSGNSQYVLLIKTRNKGITREK